MGISTPVKRISIKKIIGTNAYHLKENHGSITRDYFGEMAAPISDVIIPHGFGYAWIAGGVRPCMLRGFWWHGHFRYGDRLEATENVRRVRH